MVEQRFCKAKAIGSNPLAGFKDGGQAEQQTRLPGHQPMSPLTPLHHLPRPAQNLPYLIALAVAPLINLAISINSFHHFQNLSGQQLPINHWIFGIC